VVGSIEFALQTAVSVDEFSSASVVWKRDGREFLKISPIGKTHAFPVDLLSSLFRATVFDILLASVTAYAPNKEAVPI